ncbi:MAG TPA: ABC transporter ATP-binding protein [Candidatus Fimimorpha excrementavium]|nr:ABC transporter ATP-binding protein [Candidatus Fimimorpha excrementavium]
MLKMFKRLKSSAGYILLIFALLFLQAYCDLSLPSYTSNIVDVGIQQKGIEDGVPDKIRESSLAMLEIFMDEGEREKVDAAYTKNGDIYEKNRISSEEREELNDIFSVPMMIAMQAEENGVTAEMIQNMPQEQLEAVAAQMDEAKAQIEAMPESIITQSAVAYVQQEYAAMGEDVDSIQMTYVLISGVKMLGMALLIMVCAVSVTFLSSRLAAKLGHDLRNQVYRKVISFSNSEMDQFSTASLITRSTNDIQQVQMMFAMLFRIVLYAPILGIGGVLKVMETDSSMTWILAVAVGLILALVLILMIIAMPKFNKLQTLIDRLNLVSREILTGIPVIRAFSREKHEEDRFEVANRRLMKTNLFVNRVMTVMMPLMMLIMNGITVLIVYSGSHAVDQGQIQVGSMMAFIQYTMQIIMSFLMITMLSVMLPRAEVSAKRINEVLSTKEQIENPKQPLHICPEVGTVEFQDVTFSYPGAEENVLSHISFKAQKGETVAFIGSTGSGKSTLVNLIPRLFDVTSGKVLVDGVDVREMDIHELRDKIGFVPQKGVLFSGTIASNICYGAKDASQEDMKRAARIAQAEDFIEEKEDQYEDPIAQGGSNVSGGQKQRLSIARAIAKNPEIFIFDDSFSALDFKTDLALRQALKRETKNATTLIVAQRISTIIHADKILVLDEGEVAGMGTHKELLQTCPVYQQIAKSQLSEEELDV